MRFDIHIEDESGKAALRIIVPKIIGDSHTFKVFSYKGIGRIPKGLGALDDAKKRMLLNSLPQLLRGYGKYTASATPPPVAVIVVCDLDKRCFSTFRQELLAILEACNPKPTTRFCIAIKEGEAWLLGDKAAVKSAYPKVKTAVLEAYQNDSICGTWEKLADAVYPGGAKKLTTKGWQAIGFEKSVWAKRIAPHMDVDKNASPSFGYFREKILKLKAASG